MGANAFFPAQAGCPSPARPSRSGRTNRTDVLPDSRYSKLIEACRRNGNTYQLIEAADFELLLKTGEGHHGIVNAPQEGGSYKNQATIRVDGESLTFEILTKEPLT